MENTSLYSNKVLSNDDRISFGKQGWGVLVHFYIKNGMRSHILKMSHRRDVKIWMLELFMTKILFMDF